jgi:putative SOS response-associated peptidase YedK
LNSFAAITDEPPPEIAAAGHDRVVITLKHENVNEWLASGSDAAVYYRLFDNRERPFFEHRRAA